MSALEKGILAVLLIFAAFLYILPLAAGLYAEQKERRKRGEPDAGKAQYDERQQLIRLKAAEHALYALGGYLLVWMWLEFVGVLHWEARTLTLLPAGLLLAVVVWSGECILRGAMLGFNQKKAESGQIIVKFALGFCWLLIGGSHPDAMSGSLGVTQMLIGVGFLIQGGLMLYARQRRKLAESLLDTEDGDT